MIYRAFDIQNDIRQLLKEGMKPGLKLGLPNLDKHYSVRLGNTTIITSYPTAGKTFFVLNTLVALTLKHGMRHFLYTPEMGEPKEVYALLIEVMTGMRFDQTKSNRLHARQLEEILPKIHEYFFVYDLQDSSPDMATALNEAEKAGKELGANTFTFDNYNDLRHHEVKMIDLYNEEQVVMFNKCAKKNRMHGFLTAHPRNLVNLEDLKEPPSPDKIKGGSAFWSKGQTIIGINRIDNVLQLKFWKIKPRVVGERGDTVLGVDFERSTYYEVSDNGYDQQYMFEQEGWPAKQKLIPLSQIEEAPF